MEALFMQAFERRDAAEAQMRQQVASYSETLTCALLAAGHLPPPWLLPHPAAFGALERGGLAEAQMKQQVDAYSRSLARTLSGAGHLPPPWLLPPDAGVGALELRDRAEEQMRQQVESYSQSLACALLAAGPRPPPWLLQPPADVATHGNTVTKQLVDPANPRSVDHVHHELTEVNHQFKQKTSEAVAVKPGIMNITRSAEVNGRQKCASESVIESTGMHSSNENPSPANSVEVPHSAVILLLQNETSHSVEADFCKVPHLVTILLPEKETTHAAETEPLEGPRSSTTPLLQNDSVKPSFLKGSDSVAGTLPENDSIEIAENGSLEVPCSMVSLLLEKDTLRSDEANFHEGTNSIPSVLLNKKTTLTDSLEGPQPKASSLLGKDMLHCARINCQEGHAATQGNTVRKLSVDLADLKSADHVHHVFPEINHWVKQRTADEAVEVKPVIMNINSSEKFNQCQKCTCKTVIDSTIMCVSSEEPSTANSVEVQHPALSSLLQNDALHSVDADLDEATHPITSCTSPRKETSYTAKTECLEDPMCIATPLLKIDSFHSVKPASLEGLVSVAATNPENDPIATNPENDSLELPHSMEQILTDSLEKDTLHCVNTNHHGGHYFMPSVVLDKEITDAAESESSEGPNFMANPLIENESLHSTKPNFLEGPDCVSSRPLPENDAFETAENVPIEVLTSLHVKNGKLLEKGSTLADSLEGSHGMASPPAEKDFLHCVESDFLQGTYCMPSLLLDEEAGHTFETTSLEGPFCLVSPMIEKDPLNTIDHTEKLRKRSSLFDRCDDESSRTLEQQSSGYNVLPAPINESALQPYQLADNTSEARDVCAWNNIYISSRPEALSAGSCKSARALHTAERNRRMLTDKSLTSLQRHGTEQKICFFDNAVELNADSCAAVSDNQTKSLRPSAQHLYSSGCSKKFSSLRSEMPDVQGTNSMANLLLEKEPALTDSLGGPHFLASPLLEKATLHCIQTQTDLDKILLKYTDDGEACQNSIVSSGTIISHNGSCIANAFVSAEIHCGDSSTGSAEDAFVCAESESAQMQSSLAKIPLECVKTGKAVEAQMASAAQFTLVESVQREPILDSIKCQPRQSDHAHANFPNKGKSVMPNVSSGASSKIAGVLHTTESKITTNESLQTVNDKQNNSPETSCEHSCSSVSGEMFSSLESHVQRTASHLDKLSASEIQVNWNSSCEKVEMNGQSDDELYGSSSIMSTSSSLDNQDDYDQKKTRGNLSGKALPSLSCLSRLGSRECSSPNIEERINASNRTSPLTHEVQAAANYSPEKSMSNLSDAIHCSSPILQASLCSGSSLNTKVTTIPQHSRSYSLANNLDSAFASVAGFSDFQADGERCYIRQENSSVECPNGGLKTARAEDHSKFDETMQECKNFSIPVRSNSPTISDRAFQAFCESTKLINLSSSLSAKYKMKPLDGVYQSLPSKFEKLMNRSLAYSLDGNLLDQSHDSKKLRDFGKYSLDLDGVFMMSDDLIYGSSYAYGVQEDSDVPLTLLVEKYNLEKLSGRTGSSSGYLVSIPKLDCYRIDEDSTILGKNENQVNLSGPVGRKYSRQGLTAKKPLGYATNIYKSKGTSSLDLTAGKSYTRKPDRHVHIRANQDIKNPKDNCAPSIRKAGKVIHPLLGRLSKAEMSSCKSERNRSKTNLEKGFRPRNIVSNMTSFVPNVKQKQRPLTSCGKRDVRVRALEAAEAAKRREEKKQTEREKRKAAVALERERLKQEKEHRQEQVEQQKKRDADIITRKRQRENDGKRGNGRKTKCAEEAPKRQKKLVEIMYSTNVMKDACPNNTDGKDMVEHLVKGVKNPLLSDERMESVHRLIASESNSLKCISADWKSEGYGLQVQESLSDNVDMYYEMSPYEDSDEGDIDELELKREIRRSCRLIPSWAQAENLDKILLSNQALDPREVFAHKCSFSLSNVLTPAIPHRLFN
nr:uncharacterized protein LOC117859619 isoform X3 [Setaria viridis]